MMPLEAIVKLVVPTQICEDLLKLLFFKNGTELISSLHVRVQRRYGVCFSSSAERGFSWLIPVTFRADPPDLCGLSKHCLPFSSISRCHDALCLPSTSIALANGQCRVLGVCLMMIAMTVTVLLLLVVVDISVI